MVMNEDSKKNISHGSYLFCHVVLNAQQKLAIKLIIKIRVVQFSGRGRTYYEEQRYKLISRI